MARRKIETIKPKLDDRVFLEYLKIVTPAIKDEIEQATLKTARKGVKEYHIRLYKGHGVRRGNDGHPKRPKGTYKKSVKFNDLSRKERGFFSFQIAAKPPEHRLTHLLENGHDIVKYPDGVKTIVGHANPLKNGLVEPVQNWADNQIIEAYKQAIDKALKKGKQ